jgi:hypothetical protein
MSKSKPSTIKKKTLNENLSENKYNEILTVIENTDIPIEKLHSLFDTLHDFGKFSISYDTLCNIRDNPSNHNISKMIFSLLAKHCFGISDDDFSRDFSNLTTSMGGLTSNLTAKDLENFFLKYALAKAGTNVSTSILRNLHDEVGYQRIIKSFNNYNDENTGCINLFVDTQKNVYKCIIANNENHNENKLAVVMTRESIYDAAPKLDSTQPESFKFLGNNFFIESGQGKRTYSENESGITIELSKIKNDKDTKGRNAVDFTLTKTSLGFIKDTTSKLSITNCVLNSSSNHPNCITYVNKEINKFMNTPIEVPKLNIDDVTFFYINNKYNENINTPKNFEKSMNKIILEFTKKRFGDFKQLELVEGVNKNSIDLQCYRWNTDNNGSFIETNIKITKLILVTIDRMLFARCIFKKVPAILDFGNNMYFYNPGKDLSAITGGTISNTIPKSLSFKYEYPKVTKGGALDFVDTADLTNMIESLMENPSLFFDFFPFIVRTSGINGNSQTALIDRYNDVVKSLNDNKYLHTHLQCEKPYLTYYKNNGNIECYDETKKESKNSKKKSDLTEQVNFFYFSNDFSCKYNNENRTIIYGKAYYVVTPEIIEGMIQGYNDKDNVVLNFFLENGLIKDDTIHLSNHSSPFSPATQSMKVTKSYNMYFLGSGAIIFILIFLYTMGIYPFSRGGFNKKKLIKVTNSIAIYGYLWVFKLYEMRICTDIEQLKIDYDDCNVGNSYTDYYVPTHKRLYILFDKLIEDYEKDEIYIGLLEKYLFEYDYELYYRIQEIKRCVLGDSNYNIDFAEFDKFNEIPIYEKTYKYFDEALKHVNTKNEEIQNNIVKYYENNQYDELYKYCKDDLKYNRYTFLNMYSDFYETIIPLFEERIILKNIVEEITKQKFIDENKVPNIENNVFSKMIQVSGGKQTKHNKRRTKKHNKRRTKKITKI